MEARTDDMAQDSGTALPGRPANGANRRTPTGGPTTADGARYLEELRARWRAAPKDGPRVFNPDETSEQRQERIRHAKAVLESLQAEVREPATEEERREVLRYEEILANIDRDYTMSVVPPSFILNETPAEHQERLRETRAGLAALREGDPDEHRETLESVLRSLDDDASWNGEPSSE